MKFYVQMSVTTVSECEIDVADLSEAGTAIKNLTRDDFAEKEEYKNVTVTDINGKDITGKIKPRLVF